MKLNPFSLERFFAEYEFSTPHLLACSDCETMSVRELLELEDEIIEDFSRLRLGYTDSRGSYKLREAVARLYETIDPDEILIFCGAEEAIYAFVNTVHDQGDHVVIHRPCYQSLREVARAVGCRITDWVSDESDCWKPDPEFLRDSVDSRTKTIIVNFPHNPTGSVMDRETFNTVRECADRYGSTVFSDEVYRFLEYNRSERLPSFCDVDERAVSLGVMSKSFGLAGLRIGWIATHNRDVLTAMAAFKDYTTICAPSPSEYLAALALRHADTIIERNLGIIRTNLSLLRSFFSCLEDILSWSEPSAGPVAFPRLYGDIDGDELSRYAAEKAGVLILPGSVFGDEYRQHFRIGFGRRSLPETLEKFEKCIHDLYR